METVTSIPVSTIEPLDEHGSAVRFETQCIVIPDPGHGSRRPRVVTKSYSLPLWKRRTSSAGPSASARPEDASFEENQSHLELRVNVPLPTFSLKSHSKARSVDHTPLPPCLVHRPQPSGPCASTPTRARHTRTSRKLSPSPSSCSHIVTVPLRPCCTGCQSITEAALVGGDAWPEHFSRAASRRRSMSADGSPRTITIAGSAASAAYGTLGVSISVDEVDRRRRSSDTGPSTTSRETLWSDDAKAKEGCRVPLILRRTAASSSSATDARPPPSPTRRTPATPCIPEEEDDENENENELFPLPSPKRTPTTSPVASPAGSLSSLMVTQVNQSSIAGSPSTCSGESSGLHSSKRHFLAPPPCSSSSSLSLPKLSESTTDLTLIEDSTSAPSPSLLSTLPSLSGRPHSWSPSPRISFVPPTPTDTLFSAKDSTPPKTPQSPKSVPATITIPSSGPSQSSASSHHSQIATFFPRRFKRSVSVDAISPTPSSAPPPSCLPSASPTLSTCSNTKKLFWMSSPRHIIADVLRGVGAMGSSGIGPGI
ncbi:hypothetical protein HD554DRAFT_2178303 [Boletus coccyginus]|nr:hypothetical protein HD554DRAFT_2178303 [Boletus coccyginus]